MITTIIPWELIVHLALDPAFHNYNLHSDAVRQAVSFQCYRFIA